jgi:hypothetical protein
LPVADVAAPSTIVVEKLMSLSPAEFEQSLSLFLGREIAPGTVRVREALDTGTVDICFMPHEGLRLGGLLELPRARVSLTFEAVPEPVRSAYVRRFEIAFQRGGG